MRLKREQMKTVIMCSMHVYMCVYVPKLNKVLIIKIINKLIIN